MPVSGVNHVVLSLRDLAKYVDVPMNSAARYSLRPTLSQARANARSAPFDDSSGLLAKSLGVIKNKRRSRRLRAVHQVGPRKEYGTVWKGRKRRPVKYAHLVEFGTATRGKRGGGKQRPGARKKPFLTPAYMATRKQVEKRFNVKIGPEMEKRAAKLRARQVLRRR